MKRRWLPRICFSLRTLLLIVLTAASGATLWWNWGPWAVAFSVKEPGEIDNVYFTEDDDLVVFKYRLSKDYFGSCADVRVAKTGRLQTLINDPESAGGFALDGNYLRFTHRPDRLITFPKLYDIRTGQSIGSPPICVQNPGHWRWDLASPYLILKDDNITQILRLPKFELVQTLAMYTQMADSRTLIIRNKGHFDIQNIENGKIISTPDFQGSFRYRACNTLFFDDSNDKRYAIDASTGKLLYVVNAIRKTQSRDGTLIFVRNNKDILEIHDIHKRMITGQIPLKPLKSQNSVWAIESSPDNTLFFSELDRKMFDGKSLKLLWGAESDDVGTFSSLSETGEVVFLNTEYPIIVAARSGKVLLDFSSWRWRHLNLGDQVVFANHSNDFIIYHWLSKNNKATAIYFHQSRPIAWYGPAYLPEFWLTVLLSAALLWSFHRDRKNA